MYTMAMILGIFGYGVGYEGMDSEKMYIGVYTPRCEYGWVVTSKEIYLDTIMEKGLTGR